MQQGDAETRRQYILMYVYYLRVSVPPCCIFSFYTLDAMRIANQARPREAMVALSGLMA